MTYDPKSKIIEALGSEVLSTFLSGSSFICDPPVLNTDVDYFVLVRNLDEATSTMYDAGWSNCLDQWADATCSVSSSGYEAEDELGYRFAAFRLGEVNAILTADMGYYLRNCGATLVAKHLNLTVKRDRIDLFKCMRHDDQIYTGPLP